MTRALVLGATGHIGAHVVRALLSRGYDVRAAYRQPRYRFLLDGLPVEPVQVDLDDPRTLEQALAGCELVFHCAGYYPAWTDSRPAAVRRGIEQVDRVFEVLNAHRLSRIVYTSSAATITPACGRAMTEADQEPWPLPHWRPLYATVKIAMEHAVLRHAAAGSPVVLTNPSVCIGEYDAHAFSGQLVLLFARRRLPVYVDHSFGAVYTGDVGIGHVLAAERGRIGQRYLLTTQNLTLGDLAKLVAERAHVRPPRWRLPYPLLLIAAAATEPIGWIRRREPLLPIRAVWQSRRGQRLDGTEAVRELGMPQTPVDEAVRRCVAWFRQQQML